METLLALVETKFGHVFSEIAGLRRESAQRFTDMDRATSTALSAQEKAVEAALVSSEKAVTKAEVASEKRLDSVNEFRAQQTEILAQTMPRVEAAARFEQIAQRMIDLSEAGAKEIKSVSDANAREIKSVSESNTKEHANLAARLDTQAARLDKMEGRGAGMNASWVILVGAVVLIGAVIGILGLR